MTSANRTRLALVVLLCLAAKTAAFAKDGEEKTATGGFSSLDPLAQSVAPDLSRIADENAATASDLAQQGALAIVFCPTHQTYEPQTFLPANR